MDYFFLSNTKLFRGIQSEEVRGMIGCLGAYEKRYPRGTIIYRAGDRVKDAGLVLDGSVNIVVNTYWGTASILGHIGKGGLFAESYAAVPERELLCDVVAAEDCRILFLNVERTLIQCQNSCTFHNQLIRNLTGILAAKNLGFSNRMMHITPRTIRERLLSYLSEQMLSHGDVHFTIPFSRQQLAEYLCVDRAALSHELSKMQKEGLLNVHKNTFTLSSHFREG